MFNKSIIAVAAFALAAVAAAADPLNPFTGPLGGETLKGGTTMEIKWKPNGGKNVKLILKHGDSKNLDDAEVIAANIPNSGVYKWEVPNNVPSGKDYALAIEDLESTDKDAKYNYTGLLSLATDVAEEDKEDKSTSTKETSTTMVTKTTSAPAETTTADEEEEEEDKETKTTSAAKTSSTADETEDEKEPVETNDKSSASALSKSPLALVFCLAGAFFYLN